MSYNNRNNNNGNRKRIKPVELVTKSVNKKGKLKGHNKKETKALKNACVHHVYNKKGKLVPKIFNNNDGSCICKLCGARFPAKIFNKDELNSTVNDMVKLNDQSKYMSTAIGAGNETIDYFAQMGVMLGNYKKSYHKIADVAQKQKTIRNKKKKHNSYGSSQYGSWR